MLYGTLNVNNVRSGLIYRAMGKFYLVHCVRGCKLTAPGCALRRVPAGLLPGAFRGASGGRVARTLAADDAAGGRCEDLAPATGMSAE